MAKLPKEGKITEKLAKADLPDGLVSVVYFCATCRGKHTFGADYFVEVGPPAECPNDGTSFDQADQIHRYDDEDDEKIKMKRDDLYLRRGEMVPPKPKPEDPEAIKRNRIEELNREILRLKGETPSGDIVLGP